MLTPDTEIVVRTDAADASDGRGLLQPVHTELTHRGWGWQDLVAGLAPSAVCFLILDESPPSSDIEILVRQNYAEIDAVTGDDLVVFSHLKPPDHWFKHTLDRLSGLDPVLRTLAEHETEFVAAPNGEDYAREAALRTFRDFFVGEFSPPALVFFQCKPRNNTQDEVIAVAHSVAGFTTRERLVGAFRTLSRIASEAKVSGNAIEVARRAYDLRDISSLRYRNATYRAMHALDVIRAMFPKPS